MLEKKFKKVEKKIIRSKRWCVDQLENEQWTFVKIYVRFFTGLFIIHEQFLHPQIQCSVFWVCLIDYIFSPVDSKFNGLSNHI